MSRNLCSQIFRANKNIFTEIWDFQKKGYFWFSQKSGKSYFVSFSAILRSIFLSNVSFEREKKTEQDGVLSMSRTSHLANQKFQKLKKENWVLGFSGKITIRMLLHQKFYKSIFKRIVFSTRCTIACIFKTRGTCSKMENSSSDY